MKTINRYWLLLVTALMPAANLFAEEHAAAATGGDTSWFGVAAGLAMGIAVFSAAAAQGKIGSAFLEGASRNPGADNVMRTPMILALVFVETLVLFTFALSYLILGKA